MNSSMKARLLVHVQRFAPELCHIGIDPIVCIGTTERDSHPCKLRLENYYTLRRSRELCPGRSLGCPTWTK
jgi:hypothetical protein